MGEPLKASVWLAIETYKPITVMGQFSRFQKSYLLSISDCIFYTIDIKTEGNFFGFKKQNKY